MSEGYEVPTELPGSSEDIYIYIYIYTYVDRCSTCSVGFAGSGDSFSCKSLFYCTVLYCTVLNSKVEGEQGGESERSMVYRILSTKHNLV